MATYRLFPSTNGPASVTATSGGWLLGVQFSVTGGMQWLNGYFHWVPANGDATPRKFALWNFYASNPQFVVSGSVVTSGAMTLGAWNFVALPAPVQLAPGTQYVAATGWTVTTGIPVTVNQFDFGQPFASGIVNGPLTAWSAGTGSNPFPGVNTLGGQMVFSNVLGADPAAAMPNNGSGSDNLWVDVLISDTAPATYTGSYRLYPNIGDLGNFFLDTATNFTLGLEFSLSQASTLNKYWFYSPAAVTQLPTACAVFRVSDHALITSNSSPSWSGAAASGWVSAAPGAAVTLAAGTYRLGILNGAGTPAIWNGAVANYWSTGFGVNGLTAGPMTFPDNAAAHAPGQDSFHTGAALTYPDTSAGPLSYGLDVEVTPVPPSGGGAPDRHPHRAPAGRPGQARTGGRGGVR